MTTIAAMLGILSLIINTIAIVVALRHKRGDLVIMNTVMLLLCIIFMAILR